MKKGFTMIELIFVIVILAILASVAVPRLAGTKADAEESAAVANLRTLVSDLNTYYVAKGGFETGGADGAISTTWSQITNVPVDDPGKKLGSNTIIKVGGVNCIDFLITKETNTAPAFILFNKNSTGKNNSVCSKVQESNSLKPFFNARVPGVNTSDGKGRMAIGSNIKLER